MKILSMIALILSFSFTALAAKVCGLPSGEVLITFTDSVNEAEQANAKTLANALGVIASFPDIQGFIRTSQAQSVCVTGMVVSKNIYQYHQFLVVVEIQGTEKQVLPLVFQAASIQAYENYVSKPWLGFARADLVRIVKDSLKNLTFKEASPIQSPIDIDVFTNKTNVDGQSKSYVHIPDVESGWSTYLVSQLRILETGNPYTTQNLLDVAVVQVENSTNRVRYAEVPSFFAAYNEMLDLQTHAQPSRREDRVPRLQDLSK